MSSLKKSAFSVLKLVFMIILLTFISPFILDFSAESLDDLFSEVYVHADTESKNKWVSFIDSTLCYESTQSESNSFALELGDFCVRSDQDIICAPDSQQIYTYQSQICQVYTQDDFTEFCETTEQQASLAELELLCSQYETREISAQDFFMEYVQVELDTVEDDVFEHEKVQGAALEALGVPKLLRFENYLVWQRILLLIILLIPMYLLAGNIRTLTHKIGHTLVQTGGFLLVYRLIIELLILISGINTSLLFESLISVEGSVAFDSIFKETFYTIFLLMHDVFFMPSYWWVSISIVLAGVICYIPWIIRKYTVVEEDEESV